MKKTFAALLAVATVAGALTTTPASAQRALGAAIAGGIIGGAIVGGAVAASQARLRFMSRRARARAVGCVSAIGMVTTGASAAFSTAIDRPSVSSELDTGSREETRQNKI